MNLSGNLQFVVDRSIIKSYSIYHRTLTYLTEIEMIPMPGILISKSSSKSISWLQVRVTSTAPWRIDSTWQPSLTPHVSPVECSQAMKYNFSTSSTRWSFTILILINFMGGYHHWVSAIANQYAVYTKWTKCGVTVVTSMPSTHIYHSRKPHLDHGFRSTISTTDTYR